MFFRSVTKYPWFAAAIVVLTCGIAFAQGGEQPAKPMSLLQLLAMGRWFMIPLAACSLFGVTLIVERFIALRIGAVIPPEFIEGLTQRIAGDKPDIKAARDYCKQHDNPIARVLAAGLRRYPRGEEAMEAAIEDTGAAEVARLRANFRILYGVANVAPMLGLLGTVWGMIEAFQVASQQGLGQAEKLAEGIYNALVTTFAGLTIAIPVLIFYYYFQSKIETIVSRMNDVCVEVLETLFGDHQIDHPVSVKER